MERLYPKHFPESKSLEGRVKFELDWSNFATKTDLKSVDIATGVDTSNIAKKIYLANLKSNVVDKLDLIN